MIALKSAAASPESCSVKALWWDYRVVALWPALKRLQPKHDDRFGQLLALSFPGIALPL